MEDEIMYKNVRWTSKTHQFGPEEMASMTQYFPQDVLPAALRADPIVALRLVAEYVLNDDEEGVNFFLRDEALWRHILAYHKSGEADMRDHTYFLGLSAWRDELGLTWPSMTGSFTPAVMFEIQHASVEYLIQTLVNKPPILAFRALAEILENRDVGRLEEVLLSPGINPLIEASRDEWTPRDREWYWILKKGQARAAAKVK